MGPRDGSQQGIGEKNFRLKRRKEASGTEVSKVPGRKTSVLNTENGPSGRKSAGAHGEKLPSKTPKTGDEDGSQQPHLEKNFRPKRRKQAMRTQDSNRTVICINRIS